MALAELHQPDQLLASPMGSAGAVSGAGGGGGDRAGAERTSRVLLRRRRAWAGAAVFPLHGKHNTGECASALRPGLRWAQDIGLSLQESVDLPEVNVPRLEATDHREIRDEDIEGMATQCRATWGLGTGPITDALLVLENAGIVVVKEEVGTVKMDGLSNWSTADSRTYVPDCPRQGHLRPLPA